MVRLIFLIRGGHITQSFTPARALVFSVFLGLLTIYFASRKTTDKNLTIMSTATCGVLDWVTQAGAIFYPATAFFDPQFDEPNANLFGIPVQLVIDAIGICLTLIAVIFAARKNARWI